MNERHMTIGQASRVFQTSERTIREWIKLGCPAIPLHPGRLQTHWRLDYQEVIKWLKDRASAEMVELQLQKQEPEKNSSTRRSSRSGGKTRRRS